MREKAFTGARLRTRWVLPAVLALVAATGGTLAEGVPAQGGTAHDPALVRTANGPVRGTVTATYREFDGIPYAAPPVGPLRWQPPRPAAHWSTPRDATTPASVCAQPDLAPYTPGGSEDCLYLNVTTPRHQTGQPLPVMLWFHGGGFSAGSGIETRPTELAPLGNVIVVTINYRLGAFGYLDLPQLDAGLGAGKSGNFGLEDQQAAMRWVRDNAAAFGGDPRNVTLFGQWTGGRIACVQLTAPGSAGLFDKVITMSNPCLLNRVPNVDGSFNPNPLGLPQSRADAEGHGEQFASDIGCTDPATVVACLRGKSTDQIVAKAPMLQMTPVFGGGGPLPVDPITAFRTGHFAKVPMLEGVNKDAYRTSEAVLEEYGFPTLTPDTYVDTVRNFAGKDADRVLARYPLSAYPSPTLAWATLATDALLARPLLDTTVAFQRQVPLYTYEFADPNTPWYADIPKPSFPTGSFQDGELQYLFDTTYFAGRTLTPQQQDLAMAMMCYFAAFAHDSNPNVPGLPYWPRANQRPGQAQALAPAGAGGIRQVDFAKEHNYDLWHTIPY